MSDDDAHFEPMPIKVLGNEVPDDGNSASLLVEDENGNKIALTMDLESLVRAFENASYAMNKVAVQTKGAFPFAPMKDFQAADFHGQVAVSFVFGEIGRVSMKLSGTQAAELGQKLSETGSQALQHKTPLPN